MPQKKNKKILIYFFLFLIIEKINNKDLNKIDFVKVNKIIVTGLEDKDNLELTNNLNFLKFSNLLFLKESKIDKIINSNTLVEKYSIFKRYPSTLNIKIDKTKFLAQIKKNGNIFFLGSNGKLIKTSELKSNMPFIFGNFKNESFFELKKAIDQTNFNYDQIKNIFFFKSGRWDIETKNGLLIKLPAKEIKKSLELSINILNNDKKKIKEIDLRQSNQVIING